VILVGWEELIERDVLEFHVRKPAVICDLSEVCGLRVQRVVFAILSLLNHHDQALLVNSLSADLMQMDAILVWHVLA
jgi:hypothetical protein